MTTADVVSSPTWHDDLNAAVRIDVHSHLDRTEGVAFRRLLRELGVSHQYEERLLPMLADDDARLFAAVTDRPWPPWGLGARTVHAACLVYPVGEDAFAIGTVYVRPTANTNIGLLSALYKEALDHICRIEGARLHALVIDGSRLSDKVLCPLGFRPTDDQVITDQATYRLYDAPAADVSRSLGLEDLSVPELLAHEMDEETYLRNALLHSVLQLANQAEFADLVSELAWIDGGRFNASKPGGVDETRGPTPELRPDEVILPPDEFLPNEEILIEETVIPAEETVIPAHETVIPAEEIRPIQEQQPGAGG